MVKKRVTYRRAVLHLLLFCTFGRYLMKLFKKSLLSLAAAGFVASSLAVAAPADAKTITVRIASGHPPTVVLCGFNEKFFFRLN